MPELFPLKNSFAKGEITPLLHSRSDTEIYPEAVKEMTNFVPDPHGPAIKRVGSEFMDEINASEGRLFPFQISQVEAFNFIVTHDHTTNISTGTIASRHGFLFSGNKVDNSNFTHGDTDWTDASGSQGRIIFAEGYAFFESKSHPVNGIAEIRQLVTLGGAHSGNITCHMHCADEDNGELQILIGSASGLGDIATESVPLRNNTFTFDTGSSAVHLTIKLPAGPDERIVDFISLRDTADTSLIQWTVPWGHDEIEQIQTVVATSAVFGTTTMYFVSPNEAPRFLTFVDEYTWSFAILNDLNFPTEWIADNYPSVIAFHQGRLWMASTKDQPEQIWATVVNSSTDFTIGVNPADGFTVTITRVGKIRWMEPSKKFLVGTESDEYIIVSEGTVLYAGDIDIEPQSSYGSLAHQPQKIGNGLFFITPDGRKIRTLNYIWTDNSWVSDDILFNSEHLTYDNIKRIVYPQHPIDSIMAITKNGNILVGVYKKEINSIGWTTFITTDVIYDISVLEENGSSIVYGLVNRSLDDLTLCLERFQIYDEVHEEGGIQNTYIDCHTHVSNGTISSIDGLIHLKNRTVQVLVDGTLHDNVTLDENGDGALTRAGTKISVGLQYMARLELLPIDSGAPGGSSMMWKKKWNKLYLRIFNSIRPRIFGKNTTVITPLIPTGEVIPITEDVEVSSLGYNNGEIIIEHDTPFPCNITGVFGKITSDSK